MNDAPDRNVSLVYRDVPGLARSLLEVEWWVVQLNPSADTSRISQATPDFTETNYVLYLGKSAEVADSTGWVPAQPHLPPEALCPLRSSSTQPPPRDDSFADGDSSVTV